MKLSMIAIIVLELIFLTLFFYICISLGTEFIQYKENLDFKVGHKTVINNDTLQVIDYSIVNNTCTLSNGMIVNSKIIKIIE